MKVKYKPNGYHDVKAYLVVNNAEAVIEFAEKVFDATLAEKMEDHGKIIMAFPDAEIYSFDTLPIQKVNYDDLEHVTLTKSFLQNPQSFINKL